MKEDNHARALTHQALFELKSALDIAPSADDFLTDADSTITRPENQLELHLDMRTADPLDAGSIGGTGRDIENAPAVYEYLGALDRANACDRRLWTYLSFATYRDYMEKRWPLTDAENWRSRVEDRWLMLSNSRGRLVRHGISRLWWVAALTYDPRKEHPLSRASGDPFAYTREVFKNEDRLNALFDREAGALPELVRCVLEHAARGGAYAKESHIRALMKELTLVYGYRDLGSLDRRTVRGVVAESAPLVNDAD
ncbi:MAG: DUF6339 family protein [Actinomycetota bacterium]